MSTTIPTTASPTSNNITVEHMSLFPSDVDDKLMNLFRNIAFIAVICALVLGFVTVVSSLKSLHELTQSSTDSKQKKRIEESWVVRKLKSKYAAPFIICVNGMCLVFGGSLVTLLYFDVGGEAMCSPIQHTLTINYTMSMWTTYIIFEIRRIVTGTENLKGMKYWVMQAVRFNTLCMVPCFAIGLYFVSSGLYLADARHCILAVNPTLSMVFGVAHGILSMGHIMLFIFAVRQKSSFKVAAVGSSNRIKPSVDSSPKLKYNLARINGEDAGSKIHTIARRNLQLASVTVITTGVSMVIVTLANSNSPPQDSPSARSYFYLGHVCTMTGILDLLVNSLSILSMTSSWQPANLKKVFAKIRATVAHKPRQESEVSTLGGGS